MTESLRPLRILIDLQSCQSGSRLGGIGRYSMALAKAMIRQGRGHEFYLLLNRRLPAEQEVREQFRNLLPQHRILTFDVPLGAAEMNCDLPRTRLAELVRERFITQIQPDVVHVSSLIEGVGDDTVTSVGELYPASRTCVTLYDLIPLVERDQYLSNHVLEEHYLRKIDHLRRAGMLLAISDYSRAEGIEFGGLAAENVVNISSGVDEVFRPRPIDTARRDAIFAHYGIRRGFLMYASSFDSRKNQANLVRAFGRLPVDVRAGYQLLIVGNGSKTIYDKLRTLARDCGLAEEDVLFTGRIEDEDLLDLYNLCSLFVFPSLREGFGLPVLEAMSCGIPTIGSNTTSVPEVLGRSDAMFDPTDVASIANKIARALTDQVFREDLKVHALRHAATFSWDISACKALDFIEAKMTAIDAREAQNRTEARSDAENYVEFLGMSGRIEGIAHARDELFCAAAAAVATNEVVATQTLSELPPPLKIGWVTTWNVRCGIAAYTRHLAEHTGCEAHIFAPMAQDLTEPDGPGVHRCWTVGSDDLERLGREIERADVDAVSFQVNYGFFNFSALSRLISQLKRSRRIVTVTLHATTDPPPHILDRRLADLAPALQVCDAVLVHSGADIANLNQIGVAGNVVMFPQGVVRPIEVPAHKERRTGAFRIGTYGFFLPRKGLEQVIEAVALLRAQGACVELEMVNAEYSQEASEHLIRHCRSLIQAHGLGRYVHMSTDYLDEQDSLRRLATTDLVVFAYQGTEESSSAAVRMGLASGTQVAVTPLKIFEEVEDLVVQLPGAAPQELAQGIHTVMAMMAEGAPELSILRENTRRWVENHQFRHLSRRICNLMEEAACARPGSDLRRAGGVKGGATMNFDEKYNAYLRKLSEALTAHDIAFAPQDLRFSDHAFCAAAVGDWDMAATELRDMLRKTLNHQLSESHKFLDQPRVRRVALPGRASLSVAIVNEQSLQWYGSDDTVQAFDFLLEAQRGLFRDCRRFLDLGGHQLIWACFYAMTVPDARVVSYEPSILNVTIGLFNSLMNGVVDRIEVIPYAILVSNASADDEECAKMLVDFMTVPMRGRRIKPCEDEPFDFIKTDIEGYEFELLGDPVYLDLLARAKSSHLELHLGHLAGRGVGLPRWLERLRAAGIEGAELHSTEDMYGFLERCDPNGFHAFNIHRNPTPMAHDDQDGSSASIRMRDLSLFS